MLKSELIATLEHENPHLSPAEVERVVAIVFETITQTLEKGARVELRGFGTFTPRRRKARAGRNPRSGEQVAVPEKFVPFFRAGKELRDKIDSTLTPEGAPLVIGPQLHSAPLRRLDACANFMSYAASFNVALAINFIRTGEKLWE